MENLGIFYDHLVYFTAIENILWSFGIFSPVWYLVPRKIWQPWIRSQFHFLKKTNHADYLPNVQVFLPYVWLSGNVPICFSSPEDQF
jgi:cellobiose-specific phosphotransferase system component IIC